ncbi:cytochrome c peroxidase [Hyphomicrobium sp. CS1GBMeth3]|uniref:cytochrome-c peroxidase n=1 Tax=Hyphomicrobium sp. CS1GBMeth3 TaxID=1892845 RepID=UPI000931EA04|nr:cytochrome c peroxidase [Hyphomicrobium sp. CS1GBMeth3]
MEIRRRRMGFMIAALATGLVSWWGLAPAAQEAAGPADAPSREAIWRSIFARPAGLPEPVDPAKAALGRDLFHDTRLSGSATASCASCHDAGRAFTDGRATAVGPGGATLSRNAPTLYNLAWATSFFWDGRAQSLAEQARFPILEPDELAGDFPTIIRRLSADAALPARFKAAFPGSDAITEEAVLEALAAYERTLVSPPTRFDRWVEGDDTALSDEEKRGFDIFVGKGGCVSCHGGWRFTDDAFHDVGLPGKDIGRGALTADGKGLPEFRTPSLREVARTAPYMHDGSLATLKDVVDHYAGGLVVRPSLAPTLVRDLSLSEAEKAALIGFLKTISSEQKSNTAHGTTRPMIEK